jgi:hypothetical protein
VVDFQTTSVDAPFITFEPMPMDIHLKTQVKIIAIKQGMEKRKIRLIGEGKGLQNKSRVLAFLTLVQLIASKLWQC